METKKLEILVIEDNPKHMEDVRKLMEMRIESGVVSRVDYATNLIEAKKLLESNTYSGIMSDVFFPETENGQEGMYGPEIGQYALDHELPFVLVTSTYHHGSKTQPACVWAREKGIELVDADLEHNMEGEATSKAWKGAFAALTYLIEGIEQGEIAISSQGMKQGEYVAVNWMVFLLEKQEGTFFKKMYTEDPLFKKVVDKYCSGMFE